VPREQAERGTRIVAGLVAVMLVLAVVLSALIPAALGA
jgi:hypothetical protein